MLLHVIPHNYSERSNTWLSLTRHANIRMDICQIGYDICEFDSLMGLGIDIIGRVHFDNRDKFAIWMGNIGKATEPCQQTMVFDIWLLTISWTLTWEMIRKRNFYCFVYRQHIRLKKWQVIVGGHDWSYWDLWIYGGRGFVGVQRRSCFIVLQISSLKWTNIIYILYISSTVAEIGK